MFIICLHFLILLRLGIGDTIGGGNASEVLQQAVLPVVDHNTFRDKMKDLLKVHNSSMLCAGGQGKGGCHVRKRTLSHLSVQVNFAKLEKWDLSVCLSANALCQISCEIN